MKHLYRYLLLLILIFGGNYAWALTASFNVSDTSGCPPLLINFTNTSTGYTSYSWDLGNGTPLITTNPNPSGTYNIPGTYTVTLTTYSGSTSTTASIVVTVHPLPNTDFTAPTTVCPGATVTFTNTTVGGSSPFSYSWNFGDGGSSTATNPTHVFPGPGYYNITLSATNAQGCTKSITKPAYIHVSTPPLISFSGSPTTICNPPGSVSFTSSVSGSGPFTYSWTFGDGSPPSTAPNPSHTYSSPGSYTVSLIVTDANGCKDTLTMPAYITAGVAPASFTGPTTACANAPVTFTNTSPVSVGSSWTYGDGSPTTPSNVHTYGAAGTYTITLNNSTGPCTTSVTHTITILPAPVASFTINPTQPCPPPTTLSVTATVPAGCTASWSFSPGGGTASGTTASAFFATPGVKTITLTVTDGSGCVTTVTQNITLYNLFATLQATPDSGCVPLTVDFTPYLYTTTPTGVPAPYPYLPATYTWNYGDGSPISGPTAPPATHTYTAVGVYTAVVTATTANGCTITAPVVIRVGTPPVITVDATPTDACFKSPLNFHVNVISGPVDSFVWVWGDGSSSGPGTTVTHVWSVPGSYTVHVIPFYNGCKGDTIDIPVNIWPPKAIMNSVQNCINKKDVTFTSASIGATSFTWYFGDGTSSSVSPVVHTYSAVGTYTVMLTTYNATYGCRDTAYKVINIIDIDPDFTGAPTSICMGGSVVFTSTVTGGIPASYQWFANGILISTVPNPTHVFPLVGSYTVTLVTTDANGCKDTMTKSNYVTVTGPDANFTAAPTSVCWNVPVTFTDASTAGVGTITSIIWRFGDGTVSPSTTAPTITHVYSAAGTYTVTEIVTNSGGCTDSMVRPAYITVHRPTAAFTATPLTPCVNAPVTFTNTSSGATSYLWFFGDGTTATSFAPTHAYTAPGLYTVMLVVTDAWGCTDTATHVDYLNVTKPNAAFLMSDSFSVCPPLTVHFTDASTGASSWAWTFGDGNSAVSTTPSNMYIAPGSYTVTLIVTNIYGCKDTAVNNVVVYGYAGAFSYSPLTGCAPLRVYFNASVSNVSNIKWDFRDGTILSSGLTDTISHVYTIPGAYVPWLILSDNTGCQNASIGLDTIKVDAITAKFTTNPHPVCLNGTFTFIDSSTYYWQPVNSWEWHFDGLTSTLQAPSHTYTAAGSYPVTLKATNSWGCVDTALRYVVVNPPPPIFTSPDTVVCVSDSAMLRAYGGVSYVWSPASLIGCTTCNPTKAAPSIETVFTVTGTDTNGCSNWDTVRIGLRTHTTSVAGGDTAVCRGVPAPLYDSGATKYTWSPGWLSNRHIWNPIATPPSTQVYTVVAQLASCIPDTNYVTVTIFQLPSVDAGPDQRVLAGTEVDLQASGTMIKTQQWTPSEMVRCDTCLGTPTFPMERSTTFHINVTSPNGCKAYDSVRISIFCDNSMVFIPNSFTPNKDGENDKFYPRGKGLKVIKTFRIYNRWGELMYQRDGIQLNDESVGWDGSFNGNVPRPDVYVYYIEAVCYTEEPIFIKGDVTILK